MDTLHILADLETAGITAAELPSYLASVHAPLDLGARVVLEAGESEVGGFDWPRPDPNDPQGQTRLAVLYEEVPGGAGYLRQLGERLGEVAAVVARVLDGCGCERACYACLKSYANQDEHELLDRRVAFEFLAPWVDTPEVTGRRLPSFADGFVGVPALADRAPPRSGPHRPRSSEGTDAVPVSDPPRRRRTGTALHHGRLRLGRSAAGGRLLRRVGTPQF